MILRLFQMIAATTAVVSSLSAMAADPAKNGDIGSATGKSVTCRVRAEALDIKEVVVFQEATEKVDLTDHGSVLDGSTKTVALANGYSLRFSSFVMVRSSATNKSGNILNVSATLSQDDANGKTKILAQTNTSSDEGSMQIPGGLIASVNLQNPEFLTVWYAQPIRREAGDLIRTSPHQLVTQGLLPDGTLTSVQLFCYL